MRVELLGNLEEPYMSQQNIVGAVLQSSVPVQLGHFTVHNVCYLSGGGTHTTQQTWPSLCSRIEDHCLSSKLWVLHV